MIKHERAKQDRRQHLRVEESEFGLSKLAFLVSPVPFRRKNLSPLSCSRVPNSKNCMYQALDSALKDIYDHIHVEKHRGNLPDNSILHRLLVELLPDIPERNSSLHALERNSPTIQPRSYHPQPDGMPSQDTHQSEYSHLSHSASHNHIDSNNNQRKHNFEYCYQGGLYSSVSGFPNPLLSPVFEFCSSTIAMFHMCLSMCLLRARVFKTAPGRPTSFSAVVLSFGFGYPLLCTFCISVISDIVHAAFTCYWKLPTSHWSCN